MAVLSDTKAKLSALNPCAYDGFVLTDKTIVRQYPDSFAESLKMDEINLH